MLFFKIGMCCVVYKALLPYVNIFVPSLSYMSLSLLSENLKCIGLSFEFFWSLITKQFLREFLITMRNNSSVTFESFFPKRIFFMDNIWLIGKFIYLNGYLLNVREVSSLSVKLFVRVFLVPMIYLFYLRLLNNIMDTYYFSYIFCLIKGCFDMSCFYLSFFYLFSIFTFILPTFFLHKYTCSSIVIIIIIIFMFHIFMLAEFTQSN